MEVRDNDDAGYGRRDDAKGEETGRDDVTMQRINVKGKGS